jgi:hypothetical protein
MPRRFIPPLARRNAELPWGRLDRPNAFGRAGLTPQLQNRLASEATNSATSLKQAVFGQLREF